MGWWPQLGLSCCFQFNLKSNRQKSRFLTISFQVSNLQKICWRMVFTPVEQQEQTGKLFLKNLQRQIKVKALQQGESIFCHRSNLVATTWKNKKVVCFLSMQCNPVGNDTVNHKRHGTVIQVQSAPVVKCYNWKHGWRGSSQSVV